MSYRSRSACEVSYGQETINLLGTFQAHSTSRPTSRPQTALLNSPEAAPMRGAIRTISTKPLGLEVP